jgi:hypothetical protein
LCGLSVSTTESDFCFVYLFLGSILAETVREVVAKITISNPGVFTLSTNLKTVATIAVATMTAYIAVCLMRLLTTTTNTRDYDAVYLGHFRSFYYLRVLAVVATSASASTLIPFYPLQYHI